VAALNSISRALVQLIAVSATDLATSIVPLLALLTTEWLLLQFVSIRQETGPGQAF
jgi:hypothetical protein